MTRLRALEVFAAESRTGRLFRSQRDPDSFLFTYREGVSPAQAVSLTMPVIADPYDSMTTIHPIFEMNLPEGQLLERLRLRFAKVVEDFDDFALLAIVGRSQVGRLRFAQPGEALGDVPAQDLQGLLAYRGTESLFASLLEQYATCSGISGVQPKVLLRDAASDEPDRTTLRGATHIIKSFDADAYRELAANEYFCLRAAVLAGLTVARARLSADRRLLAVERFDRNADGTYLGFEDFCVLSALRSHGRYEGSYEQLLARIGQFVSPEERVRATEQFFAVLALCCALENGDAHLKNFGVLYKNPEERVYLAPAYDLVCTTVYSPRDTLALTLNGTKAFPERRGLVRFAQANCGLTPRRTKELLAQVAAGVRGAIAEMRHFARENSDFAKAAAALEAAFVRGLDRSIGG